MENLAAIYLRSSKDRSDVSIDAQRRNLTEYAAEKGLVIVDEYSDVVESAKSENRPAFQQMLIALRSPLRRWSKLITLDHSRLSRQQFVGALLQYEAKREGVAIIFSMVPETDPISSVILNSVLEAMAVAHSMMSKEKGLAGMRENINQGFRAGGRAPRGYDLKQNDTGTVREGQPVYKSTLVVNADAPLVAKYLKMRAEGVPRTKTLRILNVDWPATSMNHLEWNALVYAGHTVWNMTHERSDGRGYVGGSKYRPRSEWVIRKNTHEALISEGEAERILSLLQENRKKENVSLGRTADTSYLLSGLLKAPDGREWAGHQSCYYRLKKKGNRKGRYLSMKDIDRAVRHQILSDLRSDAFLTELSEQMGKMIKQSKESPEAAIAKQAQALQKQISRATELQSYRATELQSYRATELQSYRARAGYGGRYPYAETDLLTGAKTEEIRRRSKPYQSRAWSPYRLFRYY